MTQHATLPEELEEHVVSKMEFGEIGYIIPWGMYAGKAGELWLNSNSDVKPESEDLHIMRVTRITEGFAVHMPLSTQRWIKGGLFGHQDYPSVPVCHFSYG